MKLEGILKFSEMLDAFRRVERMMYVPGTDRRENDSEHSYNLAMLAWYIVDAEKLDLDRNLVMRYALVHDLAEVYAGDTYIYSEDKDHLESKIDREREAVERLKSELPLGDGIFSLLERYEKKEDRESRFVYALDKIQPVIHLYLDHGRMWKEKGVTLRMLVEHKQGKVSLSSEVEPYWNELKELLEKNEEEIFGEKKNAESR